MAVEAAAVEAPPARLGPLRALEARDFRLLWLNSFSFFLAGGMRVVTVSWLMLDLTDSPRLVGVALFAQGIPLALFSLPAGVWADRLDRRLLLLVSQVATMLLTAVLAVLILADAVSPWAVFGLVFLIGSAMALGQPSRQALVPALVAPDRLMNAIVLNNMVQNLSFIIGPAVAGGLLALVGSGWTFVAQVAVLAAGLPWLLAMRAPASERPATAQVSAMKELGEGLRHVADSPFIRALFVVTAVSGVFFVGNFQALLPVFSRDVLKVGETGLGVLSASFGVGMLAGSLLIASRGEFARKGEVLLISLLVGSGVFLVFAASKWYLLSIATMIGWGFGAAFFMNLTITLIQSHTPNRLMGRVMSVQALAFFGMSPLGNLEAGALAEAIGAPWTAVVAACAVGLMCVYFLLRQPELRMAT